MYVTTKGTKRGAHKRSVDFLGSLKETAFGEIGAAKKIRSTGSNMSSDTDADVNLVGVLGCSAATLIFVALIGRKESNQGRDIKIHLLYAVVACAATILLPSSISQYVFTELNVTLVGALYPIFRATKAVCTPDEDDDKVRNEVGYPSSCRVSILKVYSRRSGCNTGNSAEFSSVLPLGSTMRQRQMLRAKRSWVAYFSPSIGFIVRLPAVHCWYTSKSHILWSPRDFAVFRRR